MDDFCIYNRTAKSFINIKCVFYLVSAMDLDMCREVLESSDFDVIDWDNDEDFEYVMEKLAGWIDAAYDGKMDVEFISILIKTLFVRLDKIEVLYHRLVGSDV